MDVTRLLLITTLHGIQVLGQSWKRGVPVEVLPLAYVPVMNRIVNQLEGNPVLRLAGTAKAGYDIYGSLRSRK